MPGNDLGYREFGVRESPINVCTDSRLVTEHPPTGAKKSPQLFPQTSPCNAQAESYTEQTPNSRDAVAEVGSLEEKADASDSVSAQDSNSSHLAAMIALPDPALGCSYMTKRKANALYAYLDPDGTVPRHNQLGSFNMGASMIFRVADRGSPPDVIEKDNGRYGCATRTDVDIPSRSQAVRHIFEEHIVTAISWRICGQRFKRHNLLTRHWTQVHLRFYRFWIRKELSALYVGSHGDPVPAGSGAWIDAYPLMLENDYTLSDYNESHGLVKAGQSAATGDLEARPTSPVHSLKRSLDDSPERGYEDQELIHRQVKKARAQ